MAIAAFSLISYFSASAKNPITGESQRVALTPDQEIALGLQAAPEMAAQHGGLHPDREGQQHVDQSWTTNLYKRSSRQPRRTAARTHLHSSFTCWLMIRQLTPSHCPAVKIFMTAALYKRLETEGQLAGILGHEVGHVLMRHGAQRLAKQKLTQGLVGAAGVAGGSHDSARMAAAIGQMVNMKYGRDDELESDMWGVRLAAEAGYDPRSMIDVMRILEEASGGARAPEMFSTHPKPANRQAYIREVIAAEFPNGVPDGLQP